MTTPVLSTVTGTVVQGGELGITGTNLIQEDTTNYDPDYVESEFHFQGSNWAADGWSDGTGMVYDTGVFLTGSQSASHSGLQTSNPSGSFGPNSPNRASLSSSTAGHFLRFYVRDDFSFGDGTWADFHKLLLNYSGAKAINVNYQGNFGDPYEQMYLNLDGANVYSSSSTGFTFVHQQNRWYCLEVEVPGASPWTIRVYLDDVLAIEENFSGDPVMLTNGSQLIVNTESVSSAGYGLKEWIAAVAVGTTRCNLLSKYEVSNNAVYASGDKVYQAPEFLADGSATIVFDETGLTGTARYLWVTNNRGDRSLPYDLSGAGAPDVAGIGSVIAQQGMVAGAGTTGSTGSGILVPSRSLITGVGPASATYYWSSFRGRPSRDSGLAMIVPGI